MQDSARIEPQMLRTEQVSEAKADEKSITFQVLYGQAKPF